MKIFSVLLLMFVVVINLYADQTSRIEGKVIDISNSKALAGVIVIAKARDFEISTLTDRYGKYSLDILPGVYQISTKYFFNIDTTLNNIEITTQAELYRDIAIMPNINSEREAFVGETKDFKESMGMAVMPMSIADDSRDFSGASSSMVLESVESSSPSVTPNNAQAGKLTAGVLNDFRKWDLWQWLSDSDLSEFKDKWQIFPNERYSVQVLTLDNRPAIDFEVNLVSKRGGTVWSARTDNTGKAELWANIYDSKDQNNNFSVVSENELFIEVISDGKAVKIDNILRFGEGINFVAVNEYCSVPKNIDILFAVDATGSMGDEIEYLKAELSDIIGKISDKFDDFKVNLGSIFYRDNTDEYACRFSDLNHDISVTKEFIEQNGAGGGGDFPEAVDRALQVAANQINWSNDAIARIMFLILDAPPHDNQEDLSRIKELTAKLAMIGVRVVPVTASGIDKSTEYLMRAIALASNGSYIFLTDDSGIGGSHIKPSTDSYDVELLNSIFINTIAQFTSTPECNEDPQLSDNPDAKIFNDDEINLKDNSDNSDQLKNAVRCYPNPTNGELKIEIAKSLDQLLLVDMAGKALELIDRLGVGIHSIDLKNYPTGNYFLKFRIGSNWAVKQIALIR